MRTFLHDDFLLTNPLARRLYHHHAATLPLIDYHGHLPPSDFLPGHRYANLTQAWIASDPYKHRAMRMTGIPERLITGGEPDRQKFEAWAQTVPKLLGNPLFHWTALELKRWFQVDELLEPKSAEVIWNRCNEVLAAPEGTVSNLMRAVRCSLICTSDDLLDSLSIHVQCAAKHCSTRVLPSLRADEVLACDAPEHASWVTRLQAATGLPIETLDALKTAIGVRLDQFQSLGCLLADHGISSFEYVSASDGEANTIFTRRLAGEALSASDATLLRSVLLRFLAEEYARRGWTMQLHLGAQRQTSSRLRLLAGEAGGYATLGAACDISALCHFFDDLERRQALPRVIIYPLNPADYATIATLTGSFSEDCIAGKLQLGPAWWYNDHIFGIQAHLEAISNYGMLSTFIGMTTDARSPLSMVRHEYFRRVLCEYFGRKVAQGEFPDDEPYLGSVIAAISYGNAKHWFYREGSAS